MQRIDVVAAVVIQADNLDGVTVFRLSGSDSSQELLSARGNPNSGNTVGTQWEEWEHSGNPNTANTTPQNPAAGPTI